jgi:hypothetical protein
MTSNPGKENYFCCGKSNMKVEVIKFILKGKDVSRVLFKVSQRNYTHSCNNFSTVIMVHVCPRTGQWFARNGAKCVPMQSTATDTK